MRLFIKISKSENRDYTGLLIGWEGRYVYASPGYDSWWYIADGQTFTNNTKNRWVHKAVVRKGKTMYGFEDGRLIRSFAFNGRIYNSGQIQIGRFMDSYFEGFIDEFRITKNAALYTSDFATEVEQFGRICRTSCTSYAPVAVEYRQLGQH